MFGKKLQQENETLREELYMLQQLVEDVADELMTLELDTSGKISSINTRFRSEFGAGSDAVVGRHARDLVPDYLRNTEHFRLMMSALDNGRVWVGAWQVHNTNGEHLWLRATLCPIKRRDGSLDHITIFANNLTRTIETSRQHENLIRAMQRSMAVIEFDLGGHVLAANDLFLDAMGYSMNEIKGKQHRMFCPPDIYNSPEYEAFWDRLRRGDFVADRFKRIDRAGREVWLEASYNPLMNARDELYKVVKFATVITEQVLQEREVSNAAGVAYETSQATDASARRGMEVMESTASVMRELADQMNHAVERIGELDQQSQTINTLIQSISGIADQTNLLALNAAIEAARAGGQGRGFAVVADEVRKLASRTSEATAEIVSVVGRNQELTSRAVGVIESGKSQAEEVQGLIGEAENVIDEIQEAAREVVEAVSRFANRLGK
ncbi:methyl-accepting chemotaxis protein [Marinobacter daepoensis]|uniref:methyl-accepting chemotaxis protein n=1 Tax=Marinobacter daepoensis TaxID=262077 RepID=UPI00041B4C50|nr:methyl-accepting chemotaxis protein [Marinobacter daepoensis]